MNYSGKKTPCQNTTNKTNDMSIAQDPFMQTWHSSACMVLVNEDIAYASVKIAPKSQIAPIGLARKQVQYRGHRTHAT